MRQDRTTRGVAEHRDTGAPAGESRVIGVVKSYLEQLEAGRRPSRQAILDDHPEIAQDLAACLDGLEFLQQAAPQIVDDSAARAGQVSPIGAFAGVLGDFQLVREIGRGGMGVVYEAQQITLERRVALKMLPLAAVFDDGRIARFRNEAKMAATLRHPNIVSVHAVGCERGVHYYAMDLVEGHSLADAVRHLRAEDSDGEGSSASENDVTQTMKAWSTQRTRDRKQYHRSIARLVAEVAEALEYAHHRGIVHRDIKPSNILMDDGGNPWITDFGLAHMRGDGNLTLTGDVLGTARYMSPEQATGKTVVDQRTDVYSLGITLYELLALRPAFIGADYHAVLSSVAEKEPELLRKVDASIPTDLETIVLKATDKAADMRYATAQELADDLRRFVDSKPIQARRCGWGERLFRWAKRRPAAAALISAVGFLLLALAVTSTVFSVRLARVAQREIRLRDLASTRLYVSDMNRAKSALDRGDVLACEEILMRYVPDSPDAPDPRAFEWFYLWDQSHRGAAPTVLHHGLDVYDVQYSPDGKCFATGEWSGAIGLWDRATRSEIARLKSSQGHHGLPVEGIAFVDDGQSIVSASEDGTVCKWNISNKSERFGFDTEEEIGLCGASVAPRRHLIATTYSLYGNRYPAGDTGRAAVWDLASRQRIARFESLAGSPRVAFSPDEGVLVISDDDGRLRIVDTSSWAVVRTIHAHKAPIRSIAFSRAEKILATGSGVWHDRFVAGEIKLWDTTDWSEIDVLHNHTNAIRSLAFSRDGRHLAAGSYDGGISLWDVASRRFIRSERVHSQAVTGLCFSPDGTELCSTSFDATSRVWNVADLLAAESDSPLLDGLDGLKRCIALTSDGGTVCYGTGTGEVEVRDLRTGRIKFQVLDQRTAMAMPDMTISPDDQALAVAWGEWPVDKTRQATIRTYRLADGELLHQLETQHPFVRGIAFSPSGQRLAVGCVDQLVIWDVGSGRMLGQVGPQDACIKCVRFHPTKPQVACTTDRGSTYFYDLDSLSLIRRLKTDDWGTMSVDFSPEGRFFVTGGADQHIRLWDAERFSPVREFKKTGNAVLHLRFSSDGQRVLAGTKDGTISLWHPKIGESLLTLDVDQPAWVLCGEFSDDGSMIVSAGARVRIWQRGDRWRELQRLTTETIEPRCHVQ